MEKQNFNTLSQTAKVGYLISSGEIINEIESNDHFTSLFMMDDFYVEIYLDKNTREITSIRVQENTDVLNKYLQNVNLDVTGLIKK
ncbi:MAG: hypothetical protein K0S32_2751 [Bacteroidetes bacterium]|jgi:hypothetical protein|nr:hypothetical protein [Bacteroidota bacterium]